ncbi:MAG: triple tyrosine motif-containing protein [Halioglobus sp.]
MATASSSSEIIVGYRAAGLIRYNVNSGHTARYTTTSSPSLSSNQVSALLVASSGDLYVGTYGGGVNIVRDDNQIYTIRSAGSAPSLPSDNVMLLKEDSQGRVWFGTEAGLVRFDPASNSVKQVYFDSGDDIQSFVAWCLALTSEGEILAGTPANGIFEVKSVKGEKLIAERISEEHPLDSIAIFSLETSEDDSIWASTSNAIWHIYDDNTKAIRYGASAGLGSLEFDLAVSAKDSQGNLYFGGSNGYAVFNPADMEFERKPSPMLLTGLDIAGDTSTPATALPYLRNIEISDRDRFITFMFNVIDYFDSSQNRYRYMLEGFDPDWVEAGDRDSATFTNLPAGRYVFRAQGSNSDGVWNREGIRINLVVHAAPWRTWWAYTLYFLLLAGLIWSLKKTYDTYMLKEKATAMAENMNRAVEDAMDDIQEQLENQDTLVRRFHQRNLDTLGLISHLQEPDWPRRQNGSLPALEALESTLSYQGDQLLFDLQACINLIVAKVLAANPVQAESINTILDVPNVFLPASLGSYLAIALFEIADDTVANLPAESGLGNYIQVAISMTEDSSINLTVQSSYSADPRDDTAPPLTTRKAHRLVHLGGLLKTIGGSLEVDENQSDRVVAIIPQTAFSSQANSPE